MAASPPGSPPLRLGPAGPDDIRDVAELWAAAFPGRRTVADRIRTLEVGGHYGGIESVTVARDPEGRLAGAFKAYRMTEVLAGAAMPMMGLAAVAVPEWARRRGVGTALCEHALRVAADRGDVLSVLYPFRPSYYRRLGWELVGRLHEHRVQTGHLPDDPAADRVRMARGEADAAAIAACYDRVVRAANGPIVRDRAVWDHHLAGAELGVLPLDEARRRRRGPRGVVITTPGSDAVSGYALFQPDPRPGPGKEVIRVRELVAGDEAAYRGLLGYFARRSERWPRFRHFARPGEAFGHRVEDPRPPGFRSVRSLWFPTGRIVRGPMLRVVDVPTALRLRRYFEARRADEGVEAGRSTREGRGGNGEAALSIAVADDRLPANAGPWRVVIGPEGTALEVDRAGTPAEVGVGGVSGPASRGSAVAASLETGAAVFAAVFAGDLAPSVAARIGAARVDGDVGLLDRAFATREPFWLLDVF